jgi:hypothetical protein
LNTDKKNDVIDDLTIEMKLQVVKIMKTVPCVCITIVRNVLVKTNTEKNDLVKNVLEKTDIEKNDLVRTDIEKTDIEKTGIQKSAIEKTDAKTMIGMNIRGEAIPKNRMNTHSTSNGENVDHRILNVSPLLTKSITRS